MVSIGQRLNQVRTGQYISMRSVAIKAGLSPAYLGKIERNEANPTIDVLERLADVLSVNLEVLTLGVGNGNGNGKKPASLINFLSEYSEVYPELNDPDMQHLLKGICLRGRYPQTSEDWLLIFLNIRRALNLKFEMIGGKNNDSTFIRGNGAVQQEIN